MILSDKEYNMLIIEIGLKIGYYRRKSGKTQQQLAEAAEISLFHLYMSIEKWSTGGADNNLDLN